MANAARSPWAISASAFPVSLSAVRLNSTSATAIIGMTTMIVKNSSSLLRKLNLLLPWAPSLCPVEALGQARLFADRRPSPALGDPLHGRYHGPGAGL